MRQTLFDNMEYVLPDDIRVPAVLALTLRVILRLPNTFRFPDTTGNVVVRIPDTLPVPIL